MSANENLPPLPTGTHGSLVDDWQRVYTADQMREYGAECWRLGRIHGQGDTTPAVDDLQQVRNETYWLLHPLPEVKP